MVLENTKTLRTRLVRAVLLIAQAVLHHQDVQDATQGITSKVVSVQKRVDLITLLTQLIGYVQDVIMTVKPVQVDTTTIANHALHHQDICLHAEIKKHV